MNGSLGMRQWKPYPAYKDSGVEWLGLVPEGWEVKRLKFCVANGFQYGANIAAELDDANFPRYIRITDMRDDGTLKEDTFRSLLPEDALPYLLRDKDILLARSGATVGKSFIYSKDMGAAAYAGYLIRISSLEGLLPQFLYAFLSSGSYWQWVQSIFIQATIQNISAEKYACLQVTVPSFSEQQAIAAFLDRECARIDALIKKKRRLLELLEEKRRAVITQAVTRGLDPNAPMKDSGVEWIGQVPGEWSLKPLKTVIMFQRGHDLPADQREEGLIPVVSSSGISATHSVAAARGPGIVTGRYGTLGVFYLIDDDFWPLNTTLYSIDMYNNWPKFLYYMLTALSPLIKLYSVKSAVPGVDRNDLHPIRIVIPSLPEQQAIASHLDAATAAIDAQRQAHEKSIALLQEYRASLIAHAVTGKIDVRDYAPQH